MGTIHNCDPSELIEKASEELKNIDSIKPTEWALFVKTGMHKERPPIKNDWWYMRAASILRAVYRYGPIGVSKLRTKYGGKKNRGMKPERFYKGSGSIIRKIIQQLEKAEFVKTDLKSIHKGRLITAKGKKFLDDIASKISKVHTPKKVEQKEAKPAEKKESKLEEKKPEAKEKPAAKQETKQEVKAAPVKKEEQKQEQREKTPKQKPIEKKTTETKLSNESEKGLEKSKTFQKEQKPISKETKPTTEKQKE